MTKSLAEYVINELRNTDSFTRIAKANNLSVSTVIRIFDLVSYPKPKLPETVSIDEFKGDTGTEKYQCIITDPVNKKVLDITEKRLSYFLTDYFSKFDKENRQSVHYFVSDMWKPYSDIASVWLPNAVRIVDKYHWIRQAIWAFEAVRKQEQKKFQKSHRIYFDLLVFSVNPLKRGVYCAISVYEKFSAQ